MTRDGLANPCEDERQPLLKPNPTAEAPGHEIPIQPHEDAKRGGGDSNLIIKFVVALTG